MRNGTSNGDGITKASKMGGVTASNGRRGTAFVAMYSGPVDTTFLGTVSLPTCAASGGLLLFLWWQFLLLILQYVLMM